MVTVERFCSPRFSGLGQESAPAFTTTEKVKIVGVVTLIGGIIGVVTYAAFFGTRPGPTSRRTFDR